MDPGLLQFLLSLPPGTWREHILGTVRYEGCINEALMKLSLYADAHGDEVIRSMVIFMECLDQDEDEYVRPIYSVYIVNDRAEVHGELGREYLDKLMGIIRSEADKS